MIVNLKEILNLAEGGQYAIGAYNTPNLESLMAVLGAAEERNVPVIIMHAQVHEEIVPIEAVGPVMVSAACKSSVPVCVHLDHGEDLDYIRKGLELGFTSVMFDGSRLSYEENVQNTLKAKWMARQYGAGIEAEIGVVGGREAGLGENAEDLYTDPTIAKKFVEDTEIDALACSFGTAHGFYQSAPKLDFERISQIRKLTSLPLVMHGGSGVLPEDYVKSIACGVRKINYYSYMSRAGVEGAKKFFQSDNPAYYHDLALAAKISMTENILESMKVFYQR